VKAVILTPVFPPNVGGTGVYASEVAQALCEFGITPSVVSPSHAALTIRKGIETLTLAPVCRSRAARALSRLPAVDRHLRRLTVKRWYAHARAVFKMVDVIHYSGNTNSPLAEVSLLAARREGKPLVVTVHPHFGSSGDAPSDTSLCLAADRVIALTRYEAEEWIRRGVERARIEVIGNIVELSGRGGGERARCRLGIPDCPIVLYVGRLARYKGYGRLLKAMPGVWEHLPDTHLVVAGPNCWNTGQIEAESTDVMTDSRVRKVGYVSEEEKEDLLAACDVFAIPSEGEAFCISAVEAMLYRKPVLALDIPTMKEQILDSGAGIVCDPCPMKIATRLSGLLLARERREAMSERGYRFACRFSRQEVGRHLTETYRQCVCEGNGMSR